MGVTYSMIKAVPGNSKRALLTAMNDAFINNSIRDSWRLIRIVPIPKPKKYHNDIANFRSISLISVYLKCINCMVKLRIGPKIENHCHFPTRSFAYRKGMSTATCLNEFLHRVPLLKKCVQSSNYITLYKQCI